MVVFLFKLFRKFNSILKKISFFFKIYSLKKLYPKRIFIKKGLKFGVFFSVKFDLTKSKLQFQNDIIFRDFCTIISGNSSYLKIGNNVFFNNFCSINCLSKIEIGNDCLFGEAVKIYDHNHSHKDFTKKINEQGYIFGNVKIGNNCWIGSNVVILKDVEIGDNVIIGAGCVIHKSISSNKIVINSQNLGFL